MRYSSIHQSIHPSVHPSGLAAGWQGKFAKCHKRLTLFHQVTALRRQFSGSSWKLRREVKIYPMPDRPLSSTRWAPGFLSFMTPCSKFITAPEFAQLFVSHIVTLHGLPDSIVSDHSSIFISNFWSTLASILKIDPRKSTAFHPQTDGQTECMN